MIFGGLVYDDHRRFLASLAAATPTNLSGFRSHRRGVALTYIATTRLGGPEVARASATQWVAGIWPNVIPAEVVVEEWEATLPEKPGPGRRTP